VTARSLSAARWVGQTFGLLAVLVVLWQVQTTNSPSPFFTPPLDIWDKIQELWLSAGASHLWLTGAVGDVILPSVGYLLAGWALSAVVGVGLGVLIAQRRRLSEYVMPIIEYTRAVPPPALIPIFLILFGSDTLREILFIAFGLMWIMLLNTITGVRSVDPMQIETARAFRISPARRLVRIILPAASPQIFAGLRITLSAGLIMMIVAEMVSSSRGIGYQLVAAQRGFAFGDMWAVMVLLAVLGCALNIILALVERWLMRWHSAPRGRT
jgi:ABC-type nitrate/sulfonate/bicarbonate transport system permease component